MSGQPLAPDDGQPPEVPAFTVQAGLASAQASVPLLGGDGEEE